MNMTSRFEQVRSRDSASHAVACVLAFVIVAGCGGGDSRRIPASVDAGDGEAGRGGSSGSGAGGKGAGGTPGAGGRPESGGGPGSGGSAQGGTMEAGTPEAGTVEAGATGGTDAGRALTDASSADGAAGSATEGGLADGGRPPITVSAYGCFFTSGDGDDFLANGSPAFVVDTAARCGGASVSDDPNAFAPQVTPTTFILKRRFIATPDVTDGDFTLQFAADDAAEFFLNGKSIAACTPPGSDIGFCSQTCHGSVVPSGDILLGGQVNELEIHVTNLLSVDAGNGHWGYTSILFSMCVSPPA